MGAETHARALTVLVHISSSNLLFANMGCLNGSVWGCPSSQVVAAPNEGATSATWGHSPDVIAAAATHAVSVTAPRFGRVQNEFRITAIHWSTWGTVLLQPLIMGGNSLSRSGRTLFLRC